MLFDIASFKRKKRLITAHKLDNMIVIQIIYLSYSFVVLNCDIESLLEMNSVGLDLGNPSSFLNTFL